MLIWEKVEAARNAPVSGAMHRQVVGFWIEYESYVCAVNRILQRGAEPLRFIPSKLSLAVMGAFKALAGRVDRFVETSYSQWHQFVICALQAIVRRATVERVFPVAARPAADSRCTKAFFFAQKANAPNAP